MSVNRISAQQLMPMLEGVNLVDIRDANAYAQGHIPGAQRLSNETLGELLAQGAFSTPLVVCCYHGVSSVPAAQYLAEQGFEQVYSLDGGMAGWATQFPERIEKA